MSRLDIKASYLTQPVKQWIGDLLFPNAFEEEWDELFDNEGPVNLSGLIKLTDDIYMYSHELNYSNKRLDRVFSPTNILKYLIFLLENDPKNDDKLIVQAAVVSNRFKPCETKDAFKGTIILSYQHVILEEIKAILNENGIDAQRIREIIKDDRVVSQLESIELIYDFVKNIERELLNSYRKYDFFDEIKRNQFGAIINNLVITEFNKKTGIIEKQYPNPTYFSTWNLKEIVKILIPILKDVIEQNAYKLADTGIVESALSITDIYTQLRKKVHGQDGALESFVKGLYNSSLNNDPDMPEATYLFVGPPGVGKTFLAKQVADLLGRPCKIFQMNAYIHEQDTHDLVGHAPTWKSAQDGVLTEYVSKNPRAVLIFDEIEKAHSNVIRLFLSVLEGAFLESLYTQKKVDFSKTICIFTSNAGRDFFAEHYGEDFSSIAQPQLLDIIRNDLAADSKGENDPSKVGLSAFPLEVLSRFAKGNIVAFNHMNIEKLVPMINEGLAEGAKIIEKKQKVKLEYDNELLPYLFLFKMGSKLDARGAVAKSKAFLLDNTYKILGRTAQNPEKYKNVKKLVFAVDKNDELAHTFVKADKKHVMLSCSKDNRKKYLGSKEQYGEGENSVWHYVWSNVAKDDKGYKYEAVAKSVTEEFDIEAAFIDFSFAPNEQSSTIGDGLSYIDSMGSRVFDWLKKEHPEIPIYAISFENDLGLADKKLLREKGVKDFLVFRSEDSDSISQIDSVCYGIFLEEKLNSLSRNGQLLNFDVASKLSEDGETVQINLHQFETIRNMDKEADSMFISAEELSAVKFEDVIGAEDAKEELKKFISFIKNPKKYKDMGLSVSKGILLYGPPGTGKTMMAKALANAAGCPFISTTGAQIARGEQSIRKAFSVARRYAPSIVFIDEIDAFAQDRQSGEGITLYVNELLTAMDGFEDNSSRPVFVIAATNFGSAHSISGENIALDPALLRRFGNRIYVDLPGKNEIVLYLNKKKEKLVDKPINFNSLSAEDIDFIAEMFVGKSLAIIDNIINYAGGKAFKSNPDHPLMDRQLLIDAFEEMNYGKEISVEKSQLRKTAIHEAGHAVVGWVEGGACTPVYATITSRANFLGYVKPNVNENAVTRTKDELLAEIRTDLAGRAAELICIDGKELSSGASNDLRRASQLALDIISNYGMSENSLFTFPLVFGEAGVSPMMKSAIEEADIILKAEMEKTKRIVEENKELIIKFADALIDKGHLGKAEIARLMSE